MEVQEVINNKDNKEFILTVVKENGKFLDIFVGNIVCCRHIDAELSSILESDKEIIEEHLKPVFNFFGNLLVIPESELSDYESRC